MLVWGEIEQRLARRAHNPEVIGSNPIFTFKHNFIYIYSLIFVLLFVHNIVSFFYLNSLAVNLIHEFQNCYDFLFCDFALKYNPEWRFSVLSYFSLKFCFKPILSVLQYFNLIEFMISKLCLMTHCLNSCYLIAFLVKKILLIAKWTFLLRICYHGKLIINAFLDKDYAEKLKDEKARSTNFSYQEIFIKRHLREYYVFLFIYFYINFVIILLLLNYLLFNCFFKYSLAESLLIYVVLGDLDSVFKLEYGNSLFYKKI